MFAGKVTTGSDHAGRMAFAEGRLFGTLEVGENVRRDGLKVILPQGSVTGAFAGGIPKNLLHFGETADLPQPEQDQHKERQATRKFHRGHTFAVALSMRHSSVFR